MKYIRNSLWVNFTLFNRVDRRVERKAEIVCLGKNCSYIRNRHNSNIHEIIFGYI